MGFNLIRDWPVYIMLAAFVVFVVYAIINGREQERQNKSKENKN